MTTFKSLSPVRSTSPHTLPPILSVSQLNTNSRLSNLKYKSLSTSQNAVNDPMISSFQKSNDPFQQGYTRSDKMRYQGNQNQQAYNRLFQFSTISATNQSHNAITPPFSQRVRGTLNLRSTFQPNRLMKEIVEEQEIIRKNTKLEKNIESLWKMNLLQNKTVRLNQLPNKQGISYVYNDYHSRSTNPGYARNDKSGTFFTR